MKKLYFSLTALLLSFPAIVSAQISPDDTGVHDTGIEVYGTKPPSIGEFVGSNIINPIFAVSGTIFLALFIYGGLLWMTAAGKNEQVEKAKKMLVNSVIGLIIIFSGYAVTLFLFRNLT